MRVLRTVNELRAALQPLRDNGSRIGLVPTMGAFHDGHVALMRAAAADCGVVVVSLFVNPTQFGDPADLAAYPRDDARDETIALAEGVHVLFAPSVSEVYPTGFSTMIEVSGVTAPLEGALRGASHFRGVATVVAKLFNMVQPHAAYFGQKDAQQTVVIRKLVHDLNMTVEVRVEPTVREGDGLAMSSRNVRLSRPARAQAVALFEALTAVQVAVSNGERSTPMLLAAGHEALSRRGIPPNDIEYFQAVNTVTLLPVSELVSHTLFALAVRVGGVRLIDNTIIHLGT